MQTTSTMIAFIVILLTFISIVTSSPSGAHHCATGGLRKDQGSGGCSCLGTVYYCAGYSNSCHQRTIGGHTTCSNGVFGDPSYKSRKQCFCKPSGCPAGQKGPTSSCTSCTTGQYQSSNTFTGNDCTLCPAGQYNNANAQSGCTGCGPGQYQGLEGQTACINCAVGLYTGSNSQSSCAACNSGQYQGTEGQSSCAACNSGQYQDANQQTGCKDCPKGKYTDTNQQTSCKFCEPGQYKSSSSSATSCTGCPKGQYTSGKGVSSCLSCGIVCRNVLCHVTRDFVDKYRLRLTILSLQLS